jgi:hypothetical protein
MFFIGKEGNVRALRFRGKMKGAAVHGGIGAPKSERLFWSMLDHDPRARRARSEAMGADCETVQCSPLF